MKRQLFLSIVLSFGIAWASTNDTAPQTQRIHAVIASENIATISSPMAGYVEKLNVKDGSHFKKDEILVRFDCKIQQAQLEKARAEVKLSKINRNSYARLSRLGSASKVKVAESQGQYEKAIAEEKIAQKNIDYCTIKAPFNGQVTNLLIHQHETLQLHQKMFEILSNDTLVVRVLVPSTWLSWLKIGTIFELHIKENNQTYPVTVERIVNQVDAVSRSVKIIGKIGGFFADLKSGMSGDAIFHPNDSGN